MGKIPLMAVRAKNTMSFQGLGSSKKIGKWLGKEIRHQRGGEGMTQNCGPASDGTGRLIKSG